MFQILFYPFVFAISVTFFWISDRSAHFWGGEQYRYLLCKIFSAFGILFLASIAGVRDVTIGTDVKVYVIDTFEKVSQLRFTDIFINYFGIDKPIPLGFALLAWLCAHVVSDVHFFLFAIELLIISMLYVSAARFCKGRTWLCMAAYMLFFYAESMNTMKQYLAVAICLYSIRYCFDKKIAKFICAILIASQFHFSALTALVFYPCILLIRGGNAGNIVRTEKIRRAFLIAITLFIFIFGYFSGSSLVKFVAEYHPTVNWSVARLGTGSTSILPIISVVLIFLIFILSKAYNKNSDYNQNLNVYVYFAIIGWLGVEFTVISPNIDRIFLYEKIFTILLIPNILFSNKLLEKTLQFLFLLWGTAYFSYLVIYGGWYEVYPYTSEILGI